MKINPNYPAMPAEVSFDDDWQQADKQIGTRTWQVSGLSIRAELAARAMQGILSHGEARKPGGEPTYHPGEIAVYALACANALIAELNKVQSH